MKIIDLFNKIANGEEVPKEIKCDNLIYWYDETDDNEIARYRDIHGEWLFADCYLNDEIEIIEEDKKIEPLKSLIKWYSVEPVSFEQPNTFRDNAKYIDYNTEMFFNKINEIIDYLKIKGE